MLFRSYRDALRHRDLRLLVAAFLVDQIGSWSYVIVISVYVWDRTHSTLWLGALGICRWGPGLLLASFGGVLADRYQRVTVMIVSALTSAALMAGMAVVGMAMATAATGRPRPRNPARPPRSRSKPGAVRPATMRWRRTPTRSRIAGRRWRMPTSPRWARRAG